MSAGPAKILLVDDHPANLMALEATLQSPRQTLVCAQSGNQALAQLRDDDFALVLLDVHMPVLDGYETCRAIRADERTCRVPVIFTTAVYNDRQHEALGYAAGAVDYVTKPFDPSVLRAKVNAFVEMHLQARELERQAEALREAQRLAADEAAARAAADDANRAKDHFLAVVSHELRTPLSTMLGWAQMLRDGTVEAGRMHKALETVIRCGRAQNRLIEDLLDSARIVAGKMHLRKAKTELAGLVDSVVQEHRPLAEQRRIALQVDGDGVSCPIEGDPQRLRQIVWNLLSNAIKFSHEGGRVELRLRRLGDRARIEVADDGVGITGDFLPHLFDRFRQAHADTNRDHGGLGLGLAIARHLVEAHGGTVAASSEGPGRGARFVVELPLDPALTLEPASTGRYPALRGGTTDLTDVRVLFVDDEPDARELVGQMLADAGAVVAVAASAAEAMQALERLPIDVVVSDLSMPTEDGYSLARRIAAWTRDKGVTVPTIALSAHAAVEDRERALEAGFETHMAKPFEPARLMGLISALAPKRD